MATVCNYKALAVATVNSIYSLLHKVHDVYRPHH